jgi:hypothetical protein
MDESSRDATGTDEQVVDEQVQDEREDILNACIGFAQQMLGDHGEFYPFGVSLRTDGMTMDEVYDEEGDAADGSDVPEVPVVVERIVAAHRSAAATGELLACATTLDVSLTDPDGEEHDAICVDVEHRSAEPVRCLLPYEITDDGVEYGELLAVRLEPEIFTSGS